MVVAEATEAALADSFPDLEVTREVIKTTGDRRTDVALKEVAKVEGVLDKGVFTKELEIALSEGVIDIAVHSLKDVPTVLGDEYEIARTLERAPIRDVIVTPGEGGLGSLEEGAVVGTSSVRRANNCFGFVRIFRLSTFEGMCPRGCARWQIQAGSPT